MIGHINFRPNAGNQNPNPIKLPFVSLALVSLCCLVQPSLALSLSGKVIDRNGSGMAGVKISSSRTQLFAMTDSNGVWVLETGEENTRVERKDTKGKIHSASELRLKNGGISFAASNRNALGRQVNMGVSDMQMPPQINLFGRQLQAPDTLKYEYSNQIFLYDTASTSRSEMIRIYDLDWNTSIVYGWLNDDRDKKMYRTVRIGSKTWMAQNLNHSADSSFCYDNHEGICDAYGRLYNWASAMNIAQNYNILPWGGWYEGHQGICPKGWHIPSENDWSDLLKAAADSNRVGRILKSKTEWPNETTNTDSLGFRIMPAGIKAYSAIGSQGIPTYSFLREATQFMTSNENSRDYVTVFLFRGSDYSYQNFEFGKKVNAVSIRCVQD